MIESCIAYFFDMIAWVFNVFLIRIEIFNVPILYYFLGLMLLSIIIGGLINGVKADVPKTTMRSRKR